jgi:acyl-CoA synthetase (AMP-forming)/AMP-acid ligase II
MDFALTAEQGDLVSAAREFWGGENSAAVIGLPDADLGERVAAAVQVRPGALTTAGDLAAFAARGLARFEVPADWLLLTEPLPATDVGTTDKRALRAQWNVLVARSAGPLAEREGGARSGCDQPRL